MKEQEWIDSVKWNAEGLVPAVVQDHSDGTVLMMAWMNAEALRLSVAEERAVFWSRSRQSLWRKGERSGHVQRLLEVQLDCDGDTVLLQVEQVGGIACHTGRRHCFYRRLQEGRWRCTEAVKVDPERIYGGSGG